MNGRATPLVAVLILSLGLVSCDNRADLLRVKVTKIADSLSTSFTSIRESEEEFVKNASDVYSHLDRYDLSTNHMDVKDGGIFDTFEGNKYYYKTVKEGASFYVSPMKPVNGTIRRAVRAMQLVEKDFRDSYEKNSDLLTGNFFGVHEPTSIGMLYPWIDVISQLPPGIDFHIFEWYTRGLQSNGETIWAKGPFVSLLYGWVEDIAAPVKVAGKSIGAIVMPVGIDKVNVRYFKNEPENLFLLGHDLTLVAANAPARRALTLKVIEDVDYVKQMKENSFATAAYRLSDPNQPPLIQSVAKKIASGDKSFEETDGRSIWVFFVGDVKETGFYTVGFLKK
jgi:hypothetical protein